MSNLRSKPASLGTLPTLAVTVALAACSGDGPTQPASCAVAGGNQLSARVSGVAFCAVTVTDAPLIAGFHQVVGISSDGRVLHLVIPRSVGNFELSDGVGIGGSYLPDVEGTTTYLTIGRDGRISVSELTATRARGTFEFVAHGFHQETAEPLGSQVTVTDGVFDVTITSQ
jgi:hypothetical protein